MQEKNDTIDKAHEILRKAFDEAGIVDAFYCGALLDGTSVSSFNVGREGISEYSNVERYHRLLGIVESCKYSMLVNAHKNSEENLL